MKTWGCGVKAPHIINLSTTWRWMVSFMPQPLYSRVKSPQYSMDRRVVGLQSWIGHDSEKRNSLPLPGCPDSLVIILTELSKIFKCFKQKNFAVRRSMCVTDRCRNLLFHSFVLNM
jgi:hypothetical protein